MRWGLDAACVGVSNEYHLRGRLSVCSSCRVRIIFRENLFSFSFQGVGFRFAGLCKQLSFY